MAGAVSVAAAGALMVALSVGPADGLARLSADPADPADRAGWVAEAVGPLVARLADRLAHRAADLAADPIGPLVVGALIVAAVVLARRPRSRARAALRPARGRVGAGAGAGAGAGSRPDDEGAADEAAAGRPGRPLRLLPERLRALLPGPLSPHRRVDAGEVGAMVGEAAALLRAGALPADAWAQAAGRRPLVVQAMASGRDPAVAQATAGARAAVRLAADLGAPPADVLDRTVGALVEAAAARTARETALAGPRASARLLGVLPLAGLGLGVVMGADPLAVLLDGGLGTVCGVAGVALYAVGTVWVHREVARAGRGGDGP